MLNARKLLPRSELPPCEIVERAGYSTDSTFARAYKRRFGETPGETRRGRVAVEPPRSDLALAPTRRSGRTG